MAALRRAHASTSEIRLARLAVERAEEAERAALSALLPNLTATAAYTRYDSEIERAGVGVIREADLFSGTVVASETIVPRTFGTRRTAAASTRLARSRVRDAARLVRASAARTFYTVLTARRAAALARTQLQGAIRQHRATDARIRAGVALPIDRSRAELAVLEAARRVADADATLARAQDQLGHVLALEEPVDAEGDPAPRADEPLDRWIERAFSRRADLRVLDASRLVARRTLSEQWLRFLPTLSISWTLNWTSASTAFSGDNVSWVAVGQLTVPLYDGGARYSAIRDAGLALDEIAEREVQLRRSVRLEVRDAFRRVETARRALELSQRSVDVAERARRRAEAAYAAGALTGIELDEARRQHEEAETTVLLRALDRQLAMVDLLAASGML
ncbi:MAG: TolC family protein [Deltaproteobacteria bacterium]|nr:TolC family protein [Deltaproteobacteria bacterium]